MIDLRWCRLAQPTALAGGSDWPWRRGMLVFDAVKIYQLRFPRG